MYRSFRISLPLLAGCVLVSLLSCDHLPGGFSKLSDAKEPAVSAQAAKGTSPAAAPTKTVAAPASATSSAAPEKAKVAKTKPPKVDASDEFFAKGTIPELRIRLTPKEEQQLRADQRRYVDCTLTENGEVTYKKVKLKLKGAAGSFRNLDDRPAMTLSLKKKEHFHGLDKFHLNNSVQDETYLNELIASQICREAGCPTPRVTHARVWLNDRDLGFYVLKESFDEQFLKRNFANPDGNLYEGAFCADIDAPLEKECGDGPDDMSDLKALIAACREGDQAKRWAQVEQRLDIDAFLNFVALELMLGHWDGYAQNRNNYRIYFRGDSKKAMFLPHGMDQMFKDVNYPVFNVPGPMVTSAVLQNPVWMAQYRQRVRELLPLFDSEKLGGRVDAAQARIRPVLAKIGEDRARNLDDRVREFKVRVTQRQSGIRNQFPPEPIAFTSEGWALVENWEPKADGDAKLEKKEVEGRKCLTFTTGGSNRCVSSYRTKVRLAKGKYTFEAKVKPIGVVVLTDDKGAGGAGVRLGGGMRQNQASGTTDWQTVSHPFEVMEDLREVELVAELRSTAGTALFDASSLRVVKAK